jgi:hypothetical protein
MPLTCYVVMAMNMMVPCGLKDGGNMLLWNDGTTSNFSGCHKLEDHKHINNLCARRSVVIRVTPASLYLCRKWPQYWLDRKGGGFRIRCVRLTGWRPKNPVRFPTEVKEFLFFKASLKEQYPEKRLWEDLDYNTSSESPETQQLTVIQQWKECLATIPDGKLPTNQRTEG